MKRDKIFVITSKDDPHADFIINKININGLDKTVVRFNTEDFITNCSFTYQNEFGYLHFTDSDKSIDTREILSVWYRRPKEIIIDEKLKPYSHFIKEQTDAALKGFYFSTHHESKWINPLDALYKSRLKIHQLELAKRIGFHVPDTIITNSATDLALFLNKHDQVSTKSLDYPNAKIEGQLIPLYNRIISKEEFKTNINSISTCPTLFQKYIAKKYDIRVIIIGTSLTAFAIYSQEKEFSIEDVRGVTPFDLRHEIIELPNEIKEKLLLFVKGQGLIFSAIDLIYGKDDKYYFLENNPNGQWLWLEQKTNFSLSDLFINELYN